MDQFMCKAVSPTRNRTVGLALIVSGFNLKQWMTASVGLIILVLGFGLGVFLDKREKRKGV